MQDCLDNFLLPQSHQDTNQLKMGFTELSAWEEQIGSAVVNAAFNVHKGLGPGLLERVYELCLAHELQNEGYACSRQIDIPIKYDGLIFQEGLKPDLKQGIKRIVL